MRDRSGQIAAVAFVFAILTWITVGLRCYVRIFMVKSFGLDDQLMVGTALLFSAYLVCQLGGAFHGSGVKRENLSDWQAQTALNYWYLCEVFYTMSTSLLKIAVGFFLLRITINPIHIWIIRAIMIITAFVGTTYTILVLCQCRPMSFWWDLSPDAKGECLSASLVVIFTYVVSALNSFADWTFGLLPIFIVKDLQMKKRAKVIVSSVIGLAAIGSTATIIRLPYTGTMKPYKGDFLYRTTDFAIWTTVEVGVGIVAGSMATLRPLVSATMGSSGQGSGKWWSRKKSSMFSGSMPMDRLRPTQEKAVTKTTITGGRMSEDSDKKVFLDTGSKPEQWKNGINKSVSTTVVEERAEGSHPPRMHNLHQHQSNMDSRRAGSPGAESTSTVGDHGSGNATKVHDRF